MENNEKHITRYLYLFNEHLEYLVAHNLEKYKYIDLNRCDSFKSAVLLKEQEMVLKLLDKVASDEKLPRKEALIFILACSIKDFDNKTEFYKLVKKICVTCDELFFFVKCFIKVKEDKGFGAGFKKSINKWYLSKTPKELAELFTKCRGKHGWKHKDLIKLTHPKLENENPNYKMLFNYCLKGLNKMKENQSTELDKWLIEFVESARSLKQNEEDGKSAVALIKKFNFSLEHVPEPAFKLQEIWLELIPNITFAEFLKILPRLHELGIIKGTKQNKLYQLLQNTLNDKANIKNSKIHPIDVVFALRRYEVGKRVDPTFAIYKATKAQEATAEKEKEKEKQKKKKTTKDVRQAPNKVILNCLYHALNVSMYNAPPTNLHYMVCVDMRMNDLIAYKTNVPALQIAFVTMLYIFKTERDAILSIFNERGVFILNVDKGITYKDFEKRLMEYENGPIQFQKPFEWAMKKKKNIDVFLFMHGFYNIFMGQNKEMKIASRQYLKTFEKYKTQRNKPNAKLIQLCLGQIKRSKKYNEDDGVLKIYGYDRYVPKLIEAFVTNSFN